MLKNLLILSFCLVAIKASGELNIINAPESLGFKGNDKLACESTADVVAAALGNWVDDATKWSGLHIYNPFKTPNNALVIMVTGINNLNLNSKIKSFPIAGSCSVESMNDLSTDLESSNGMWNSVNLDMSQSTEYVETLESLFDDIQVGPIKSTNSLKPDLHSEDKEFLTEIAYLEQLIKKYSTSSQLPTLLKVKISIEPISKAHGEKSLAVAEARKLISSLIESLYSTANSDHLILAVAEKAEPGRAKREAVEGASAKDLNLATYYNEDYPVIFNIILWFMVVLGFSVLAICYAIGSMDPGRDSIIYRMTSTRMKKDN